MATPYFQLTYDSVPSTQDVARDALAEMPVLVIAAEQTEGRGRTGNEWITAPRAFAASYAYRHETPDVRPVSLMAGVAVTHAVDGVGLKWPNDVVRDGLKLGGILVERSQDVTVVGLGLNLWWPDPPQGMGAVFGDDPAEAAHIELAAVWGAELAHLISGEGWPIDEYRASCATLGHDIVWEPEGAGHAVDIASDGGLIVNTPHGETTIRSGVVRNVRV